MQIVTFANCAPTASYFCFREMLASCRRFGHEPMILGWGLPWGGLGNKPKLLLQAIESGRITEDHLLIVDAFDVLLARPPCDIMAEYLSFRTPIVWGAERNLFPDIGCDRDKVFPDAPGGFRYLNSGVCVAEKGEMRDALVLMGAQAIPNDYYKPDGSVHHANDQEYWLRAFANPQISGFPKMSLDTRCQIALNMHSVLPEELDVTSERIKVLPTGTEPCIFHFNGGSKTDGLMPLVLAKLGY